VYHINIQGLSNSLHTFDFELGKHFFGQYGTELLDDGALKATVTLDKRETFIEADIHVEGTVKLVCDRSLESFDHPLVVDQKIIFKYGEEEKEVSEDVLMITHATERLELGQLMYEFIGLSVPMKRLHPRFQDADQEGIVYTADTEENNDETDPRWDILKKLNKN
jgi:uncharacterized protein